jgi:hypothetical protein
MQNDPNSKPVLDMTLDGYFRSPPAPGPGPSSPSFLARLAAGAIAVAVLAGAASILVFVVLLLLTMLPVVIVAAAFGLFAIRTQIRRSGYGADDGTRYKVFRTGRKWDRHG